MPRIVPFRPLRYATANLADVVAPPYDVVSPEEREVLGARSPHNVVHVDLPAGDGDIKYGNAARILRDWRAGGVLTKDTQPCLLTYEQTFTVGKKTWTRRGYIGLVRAEPFGSGVLAHERTLSGPKADRLKLFHSTRTALSPVFLLYADPRGAAWACAARGEKLADFETPDGVRHVVGRLTDPAALGEACGVMGAAPLLVADGHHRYETALNYAGEDDPDDRSPRRYVLSYLTCRDDEGLAVFGTHRLVHSTGRADRKELARVLSAHFEVRPVTGDAPALAAALEEAGKSGPSVCAVWPDGSADLMTLRADANEVPALARRAPVMRRLDVVVLHDAILEAALGIDAAALAAQSNVRYLKDVTKAVAEIRRGEGEVLFLMNGTPVADVVLVCESGEFMPQKSTFFYPKVLTGLCFHPLDDEEPVPGLP